MLEKAVKFCPEIFEFKVFVRSNNWKVWSCDVICLVSLLCFFSYCSLVNMCKKANDLAPKEQIRWQMTWYVSKKGLLKVSLGRWMYTFMINSILIIFCSLELILTDRLRRKCTSKTKKAQIKVSHKILGPEIFSYEEFLCKARQKKN